MHKIKKVIIILSSLVLLFLPYCSNDDSSTGPDNPPDDITGKWIAEEIITGNCDGDSYPITRFEIFEIIQSENSLTVKILDSDQISTGHLSGTNLSWTMDEIDDDGTLHIEFSGSLAEDGNIIHGTAQWTWNNLSGTSTCNGTTEVTATKIMAASVIVTGTWDGTWQSNEHQLSGGFSVNLFQDSSILSGSIDIPYIGLNNAVLKGAVSGNKITFGDIDDIITFNGLIGSDSISASGSYKYPGYNDQGSWQASKSSTTSGFRVSIVNSFEVSGNAANDITWDGTNLWIRQYAGLLQYSPGGELLVSGICPGNYPQGLAFDGTDLINADNGWGTSTIYRLNVDGKSIYNAPGSGQITGLHFDGEYFWGIDNNFSGLMIYKMDSDGIVVDSINCPGQMAGGVTKEWENIWVTIWQMGEVKICKLDAEGNIVYSIDTDDFSAGKIAFDGLYLWYYSTSNNTVTQMDTLGDILASTGLSCQFVKDITYDGLNLWAACGNMSNDSTFIYKLSSTGEILSTIRGAGSNAGGLAFDGQHLRQVDVVTSKIYRIRLNGENFYSMPAVDFDFLTHEGSSFWASNNSDDQVINFNYQGQIISSINRIFSENGGVSGGIFVDENSVWLIEKNFTYFVRLCQFDKEGNLQEEYMPNNEFPEPMGLTYDGQNFWYLGFDHTNQTHKLFKLELQE